MPFSLCDGRCWRKRTGLDTQINQTIDEVRGRLLNPRSCQRVINNSPNPLVSVNLTEANIQAPLDYGNGLILQNIDAAVTNDGGKERLDVTLTFQCRLEAKIIRCLGLFLEVTHTDGRYYCVEFQGSEIVEVASQESCDAVGGRLVSCVSVYGPSDTICESNPEVCQVDSSESEFKY